MTSLKRKYIPYIIILYLLVFLLLAFLLMQEYFVRTTLDLPHRIESYTNILILFDSLSSSMIAIICFLGTSGTILLRKWIIESQHVEQLKQEHIRTEVDQLKEQITPRFLSNILNRTSALTKTEPQQASDMLMRLGQLLRYQLYDCSRDKVLLSSEINFLKEYLALEQLYHNQFYYEVSIEGNVNNIFVSPLLFIPFVQQMVDKIAHKNQPELIHLGFKFDGKNLSFSCQSDENKILLDEDLFAIKKRLNLLYTDNYILFVNNGRRELQLNLLES